MKMITIELDPTLERELSNLSKDEGQDISVVAVIVLSQGISERTRRSKASQALDEVFSQPVPSPFNEMSEADIMKVLTRK